MADPSSLRWHPWLVAGALALGSACLCPTAQAQHARKDPAPAWRGDIAHFHEHDWGVWRGGRWTHQRHEGRLGWWWVVGSAWYFYPWPVYPYPSPWDPPTIEVVTPPPDALPPPTPYWYFCEPSRTYYPYVSTCPGGWKQVPALPPGGATSQPP